MLNQPVCQFLEWDSQFFGVRIARALDGRLTPDLAQAVLNWCCENRIKCVYFLADSDDPATIRLAEANLFQLMDNRVTLTAKIGLPEPPGVMDQRLIIKPVEYAEMAALRQIARMSHRMTRFYVDTRFPPKRADALYETWLTQCCDNEAARVLVAHQNGEIAGYIGCVNNGSPSGQIALLAVAQAFQGQGIGRALVAAGLQWFQGERLERVSVVTQARNIAALRVYEQNGFMVSQVQFWYHRWFSPNQPGDSE